MEEKTHYRKAFKSPYLSSADVVGEMNFTISHVILEIDKTKKTKDYFNTAYFVEKEIRPGEELKPMVLNVTNSKLLREHTGSPFIDDWKDIPVTIYVDPNVRFGRDLVEGLRLKFQQRLVVTPENKKLWEGAKAAYLRDKSFDAVKEKADISQEHMNQIVKECMNDVS